MGTKNAPSRMTLGAKFGLEVAIKVRSTRKRSTMPLSNIWSHLRLSKLILLAPPSSCRCQTTLVRTEAPCKLKSLVIARGRIAAYELRRTPSGRSSGARRWRNSDAVKLHSSIAPLGQRGVKVEHGRLGVLGLTRLWLYPRLIPRRSGHNTSMAAANRPGSPRLIGRKTDARRIRSHAPSTGHLPTHAPPDRPGRLAERDRLGPLDVAPG